MREGEKKGKGRGREGRFVLCSVCMMKLSTQPILRNNTIQIGVMSACQPPLYYRLPLSLQMLLSTFPAVTLKLALFIIHYIPTAWQRVEHFQYNLYHILCSTGNIGLNNTSNSSQIHRAPGVCG